MVDFSAMSGAPVKPPATYADLVALPSHLVGEIVDGELIASPRPAGNHSTRWSWILRGSGRCSRAGPQGSNAPGGPAYLTREL
jgi:hypothetical protein